MEYLDKQSISNKKNLHQMPELEKIELKILKPGSIFGLAELYYLHASGRYSDAKCVGTLITLQL